MTWEDEGLEPGESPEERREFRRMMDALGREGIRRMIEAWAGRSRRTPTTPNPGTPGDCCSTN